MLTVRLVEEPFVSKQQGITRRVRQSKAIFVAASIRGERQHRLDLRYDTWPVMQQRAGAALPRTPDRSIAPERQQQLRLTTTSGEEDWLTQCKCRLHAGRAAKATPTALRTARPHPCRLRRTW